MPVIKNNQAYPDWCEVRKHEKIKITQETPHNVKTGNTKKAAVVLYGNCEICFRNEVKKLSERESILTSEDEFSIKAVDSNGCEIVLIWGHWGEKIGGIGVFVVDKHDNPFNWGTKTDFFRNTVFDNHYHDCDEYWIIVEGSGVVYSENKKYEVEPGDCIITGMGHHHDFSVIYSHVYAVYFETTLGGEMRGGHLWEHSHGKAAPVAERI